jgi:hypothetical protein
MPTARVLMASCPKVLNGDKPLSTSVSCGDIAVLNKLMVDSHALKELTVDDDHDGAMCDMLVGCDSTQAARNSTRPAILSGWNPMRQMKLRLLLMITVCKSPFHPRTSAATQCSTGHEADESRSHRSWSLLENITLSCRMSALLDTLPSPRYDLASGHTGFIVQRLHRSDCGTECGM